MKLNCLRAVHQNTNQTARTRTACIEYEQTMRTCCMCVIHVLCWNVCLTRHTGKIHRLKMAFAIHVCECVIYKKESIQKRNHSFFLFAWINKLSTLCCLFYANTWTEWQVVVVARVPVFGWMNGKCCCNQFMRLNMCETKVCHFEATTATTTSSNQLINFYFIHT